jgi:hypothetical protein
VARRAVFTALPALTLAAALWNASPVSAHDPDAPELDLPEVENICSSRKAGRPRCSG